LVLLILISLYFGMNNYFYQESYAHDFFVNNDATIVTLVEQIKGETELINTNFLSNNNISAEVHARNAAELSNNIEGNMTAASQLTSDIAQIYDTGQRNTTTLALVVANIVDEILRKYGGAFDIGYDLTNMSNMGSMGLMNMDESNMTGEAAHPPLMNATSVSTAANKNKLEGLTNGSMETTNSALGLVKIHDYETALVLTDKVNEVFEEDLRPQSPVNETVNTDKLERNLELLGRAVVNKASPEALMEIVHVQIHPTLQQVYNLKLVRNEATESFD
jgi:hypothetical protein